MRQRIVVVTLSALAAALSQSCSCDPPAVAPDGGATRDGGTPLAPGDGGGAGLVDGGEDVFDGGGDGGAGGGGLEDFELTGVTLVQLEDGRLAELDLASGETTFPLGTAAPLGAIAAHEDRLLAYTIHLESPIYLGRLMAYDPATDEVTPQNLVSSDVWDLAVEGDSLAASFGFAGGVQQGVVGEAPLEEPPTAVVGSAVTYEGGSLVAAAPSGVRFADADPVSYFYPEHCGGLAYLGDAGEYVCALADGSRITRFVRGGTESAVFDTPTAGYRWVSAVAGGFVATRLDCTFFTDVTLPGPLDGVCPAKLAEAGGALYVGDQHGGLYLLDDEGPQLVLGFAIYAGGVATGGGRIALAGETDDGVRTFDASFRSPLRTVDLDASFGVALEDDGDLWVAAEELLHFPAGATEPDVALGYEAFGIARGVDALYAALGDQGLGRVAFDAPDTLTLLGTSSAELVTTCGEVVVYVDSSARVLAWEAASGERVLDPAVTLTTGPLVGIGCLDDQVLLAAEDGAVWGRPLGSTLPWKQAGTLASPGWYFAPPL